MGKTKNKPGPKPKLESEKTTRRTYSLPPDVIDFLNKYKKPPNALVVKGIRESIEYKEFYNVDNL